MQKLREVFQQLLKLPRHKFVAIGLASAIFLSAGGALAVRALTQGIASAAMGRLGDPDEVMDKLADRLMDRLEAKGGAIEAVKSTLVSKLASLAGKKLNGVDIEKLLGDAKGDLVAGGLSKIKGLDLEALVDDVAKALSARANNKIDALDLEALIEQTVMRKLAEFEKQARAYYEAHGDEWQESAEARYDEEEEEYEEYQEENPDADFWDYIEATYGDN